MKTVLKALLAAVSMIPAMAMAQDAPRQERREGGQREDGPRENGPRGGGRQEGGQRGWRPDGAPGGWRPHVGTPRQDGQPGGWQQPRPADAPRPGGWDGPRPERPDPRPIRPGGWQGGGAGQPDPRPDPRPDTAPDPRPQHPGGWQGGDQHGPRPGPPRGWGDHDGRPGGGATGWNWPRPQGWRQWQRNDRDWHDMYRDDNRFAERRDWSQNRWSRDWRRDRRYDWGGYRAQNRELFRLPRYYAPYGWDGGYRRFSVGVRLSQGLWAQDYWIDEPDYYRLPPAYGPYRWVRFYNDALLVDIRNGLVVDVIHDIFW